MILPAAAVDYNSFNFYIFSNLRKIKFTWLITFRYVQIDIIFSLLASVRIKIEKNFRTLVILKRPAL